MGMLLNLLFSIFDMSIAVMYLHLAFVKT